MVSGGFDVKGQLPLLANLEYLKQLDKKLNIHLGVCDREIIDRLKPLNPIISFDFNHDEEMLKAAGFSVKPKDYLKSYQLLVQETFTVIPHLLVGRNRGKIQSEYHSLEILADYSPPAVVFLIFTPTPGTAFAGSSPPDLTELEKFFAQAKATLPKTAFYLGCLRPKGILREKIDRLAINYDFAKIVMPAPKTKARAREAGFTINEESECCAFDSSLSGNRRGSGA